MLFILCKPIRVVTIVMVLISGIFTITERKDLFYSTFTKTCG